MVVAVFESDLGLIVKRFHRRRILERVGSAPRHRVRVRDRAAVPRGEISEQLRTGARVVVGRVGQVALQRVVDALDAQVWLGDVGRGAVADLHSVVHVIAHLADLRTRLVQGDARLALVRDPVLIGVRALTVPRELLTEGGLLARDGVDVA